jgi:hypothetical protein
MYPFELLARGLRRFLMLEMTDQPGGDQLVFDRLNPCRTLRMVGAHIVQQTLRMSDYRDSQTLVPLPLGAKSYSLPQGMSNAREGFVATFAIAVES